MKRRVHRLATEKEIKAIPNAYTFNLMTGRFHNRSGFEIADSCRRDVDRRPSREEHDRS